MKLLCVIDKGHIYWRVNYSQRIRLTYRKIKVKGK